VRALAALAAAATALGWGAGRPAGADQISSLQGQAAQLAAQLASESARIHSLDVSLAAAQDRLAQARAQLETTRAQVSGLARQLAATRSQLHAQAVAAYVAGGTTSALSLVTSSGASDLLVRQEYLRVAADDTSATIDRLHRQQEALAASEAALAQESRQAQAAWEAASHARQQAAAQAAAEAATLSSVQGQLAGLVAQAEQAKLAAARAAPGRAAAPAPSPQGQPLPTGLSTVAASPPPQGGSGLAAELAALRQCESGGNYATNTGNGYYGAYQFSLSTWQGLGYSGLPSDAPPAIQDQAAARLEAQGGWGQWPTCSAVLGL
jgi:peptidoglycan hydrolase CwlO-like protein